MPEAKTDNRPNKSQTREPAKGGTTPAHDNAYPSGDSPKPHGDPLRHVIKEQKKK
jgi:hypothetical protein